MASENLKVDGNSKPVVGLVTDDANQFIKMGRIDDTTKGMKVMLVGGVGMGTVTSLTGSTGILLTPNPITTTGTIGLSTALAPIASLTGNSLKVLRVNAGETAVEYATVGAGTITGSGNANEITYFTGASAIGSLAVATYPSLTELSYVKGVTSAIQTQINAKGAGTVTAVSVATANGVSGSSSGGATPALTIALGAITPTTVVASDATTPHIDTTAGSTNTGYFLVNGKTSGSLKITTADATAQTVTLTTAAQTVGAATLTIPNMANVNKTVAWLESPAFTTPSLGVATATSINGNTFTTGTYTLTGTAAKTLNFTNTLTLSGTDSTTMTFPTTSATIARTDAAQTFTGTQTFSQQVMTSNAITASGNAATVPITSRISTVTNNSAATLTITITTTSAVDGMLVQVRVLDFSAVAQTITWVNTENGEGTAPVLSNGSTTLPRAALFQFNNATTKWRCIAA